MKNEIVSMNDMMDMVLGPNSSVLDVVDSVTTWNLKDTYKMAKRDVKRYEKSGIGHIDDYMHNLKVMKHTKWLYNEHFNSAGKKLK